MLFNPAYPEFWVLISFLLFVGLLIWKRVPALIGKALDGRAAELVRRLHQQLKAVVVLRHLRVDLVLQNAGNYRPARYDELARATLIYHRSGTRPVVRIAA